MALSRAAVSAFRLMSSSLIVVNHKVVTEITDEPNVSLYTPRLK